MIEGETDISKHFLGLPQTASDSTHTKILFIIYGMKGNDAFLCNRSFKRTAVVLDVLTSLYCTILLLIDMPSLHLVSLHFIYHHFKCHVKCSEVN